jgi:hypothetical protein
MIKSQLMSLLTMTNEFNLSAKVFAMNINKVNRFMLAPGKKIEGKTIDTVATPITERSQNALVQNAIASKLGMPNQGTKVNIPFNLDKPEMVLVEAMAIMPASNKTMAVNQSNTPLTTFPSVDTSFDSSGMMNFNISQIFSPTILKSLSI